MSFWTYLTGYLWREPRVQNDISPPPPKDQEMTRHNPVCLANSSPLFAARNKTVLMLGGGIVAFSSDILLWLSSNYKFLPSWVISSIKNIPCVKNYTYGSKCQGSKITWFMSLILKLWKTAVQEWIMIKMFWKQT